MPSQEPPGRVRLAGICSQARFLLETGMQDVQGFGSRVKALRLSRGLTLRELAKKAECSPSLLLSWETERVSPTLGKFAKLCRALKMTPSDVLCQEPPVATPQIIDLSSGEFPIAMLWTGATLRHLMPPGERNQLTTLMLTLQAGCATPPRRSRQPGNNTCLVVKGRVRLRVGASCLEIQTGQLVYYSLNLRHNWENMGTGEAVVLMFHPVTFRLFEQEEEDLSWERRQRSLGRRKTTPPG